LTLDDGIKVHKVPLRRSNDDINDESPFAVAVSSPMEDLPPESNFLATQVWPSARSAAMALNNHLETTTISTVCEFGCGPGLPSITAAKSGVTKVTATDLDPLGLRLVNYAASLQGLSDRIETRRFDLVNNDSVPKADLYLLSDVFESSLVAQGAANLVGNLLTSSYRGDSSSTTPEVWVFAQSDRAQRDIFLIKLREILVKPRLDWTPFEKGPPSSWTKDNVDCHESLWLCDIDETTVVYG